MLSAVLPALASHWIFTTWCRRHRRHAQAERLVRPARHHEQPRCRSAPSTTDHLTHTAKFVLTAAGVRQGVARTTSGGPVTLGSSRSGKGSGSTPQMSLYQVRPPPTRCSCLVGSVRRRRCPPTTGAALTPPTAAGLQASGEAYFEAVHGVHGMLMQLAEVGLGIPAGAA